NFIMENQEINVQQPEEKNVQNQVLPGSQSAFILGILSVVFTLTTVIIGIILGIIAVVEGNRAVKAYELNPSLYTKAEYSNANVGKILGWVSIGIGAAIFLFIILIIIFALSFALPFAAFDSIHTITL
ncbi:MAG TPA: hypothetical protein P5301_03190, partial [Bacteroidales bacterium]|nr:hypothetical protein [Bacteroidales bacterium]HRR52453.1 hypothetical protein [Bacteroidales bacterium]HRS69109.1 hypothetical protein [Bacteroidales bacterium]